MIAGNGNGNGHNDYPGKPGPKPTWTPEMLEIIVRAVGMGHSLKSAADLVGKPKTTVESWIRRSPELRARIRLARGEMSDRAVAALWTFIENGNYNALDRLLTSKVDGFNPKRKVDLKHSGSIDRKGPAYETPEVEKDVHESDEAYFRRLVAIAERGTLGDAESP